MSLTHIVFHADIDGIMSAALLMCSSHNNEYRLHMAMSSTRGKGLDNLVSNNINDGDILAIVDFEKHARADIWIDHHYNKKMGTSEIVSDKVIYNQSYDSCFSLIVDNYRNINPDLFSIADTAASSAGLQSKDIDMIDACKYESVDFVFEDKSPMMILRAYLEASFPNEHMYSRIIEVISSCKFDINKALGILGISSSCVDDLRSKAMSIKNSMLVEMNVLTSVNQRRYGQFPRYAESLVFPNAMYNVRITKNGADSIIGISYNSWHKDKNTIHIGRMLGDSKLVSNGGGHMNVGGGRVKNKDVIPVMDMLSDTLSKM